MRPLHAARAGLAVLALALLGACLGSPTPYQTQVATSLAAQSVSRPQLAAGAGKVAMGAAIFRLKPNEVIGHYIDNDTCYGEEDLHFSAGERTTEEHDLIRLAEEALMEAGHRVVLVDPSGWHSGTPDVLLGSAFIHINLELCQTRNRRIKGAGTVVVEWAAMDNASGKVTVIKRYTGYANLKEGLSRGDYQVLYDAYVNSAKQFAADPELVALVSRSGRRAASGSAAPAVASEPLRLPALAPLRGSFVDNAVLMQTAVVTVRSPDGSGTAFFISRDGYLLTNAHVVGSAQSVVLQDRDGGSAAALVVRLDRARDVALLKVDHSAAQALPLIVRAPQVGEEVYAVGTPLGAFRNTVTKGIVSALRSFEGVNYIQADVTVQPGNSGGPLTDASGNVIGITVAAVRDGGATGLNFFIPIADALAALSIEVR